MAGHFWSTVFDVVTGRPVVGVTVEVYEAGATISGDAVTSGSYATIYSDDGSTEIDQSDSDNWVTTDARGYYEFWTNDNSVVLAFKYNGVAMDAVDDVEIIGGNVNTDITALETRVDNHDAVFGLAPLAVNLGTFTGATISDNTDVITALQELETAIEAAAPGSAYQPGGTDVALADGGTGASLSDPGADRLLFWDDSAGAVTWLEAGTGLTITGTTIAASGGGASTTQTDETIAGMLLTPTNKDYKILVKAPHGGTITETTTISASGTCTATFKVNTTALGGTANSVSSSEQSQAHASSNTFAAGDDIVITISANASCADLSFTIKYTRTLA